MKVTLNYSAACSRPRLPTLDLAALFCAAWLLLGCGSSTTHSPPTVLHVQGDQVIEPDGKPVWLKGMQLTNWTYADAAGGEPPSSYADQSAYELAASMGMNTIVLFFRSDQFESDAAPYAYEQSGFDWLDQHVAWARASGLRVVPTLLATPGSPQWGTACDGNTVWDVPDYQDRVVALWRELAKHYADEPVIAGYDLLTTPLPTTSAEQWHSFAERLVSSVREVDGHHILIVEATAGAACQYKGVLDATDLFRVRDDNVLYDVNADFPWEYVAQLLRSQGLGDGGYYPNETALGALDWSDSCGPSCGLQWKHASWESIPSNEELKLKPEQTTWFRQRFVYRVPSVDYQIAVPVLQSDFNPGKVYFDDFVINEYDEELNFVRTVMTLDLEDKAAWFLYQNGSDGNCLDCGAKAAVEPDAHSGAASISLTGTTTEANLADASAAFPVKLNYVYEMSGWLKGDGSSYSVPEGGSRFRLDFWKYNKDGGVLPLRNKDNLAAYLQTFVDWGKVEHVPLFVGEVGTGRPTFADDKGGLLWVEDMLDLLEEHGLHFAYHEYHGDDFGIFSGNQGAPDPATVNQPLVDLLTRKLAP